MVVDRAESDVVRTAEVVTSLCYRITVALSSIAVGIGVVLLVVGLLRTQLLRWAITALDIGALGAGISFVLPRPFSLGAVGILALGLVGIGYRLWTKPSNFPRSM